VCVCVCVRVRVCVCARARARVRVRVCVCVRAHLYEVKLSPWKPHTVVSSFVLRGKRIVGPIRVDRGRPVTRLGLLALRPSLLTRDEATDENNHISGLCC
jgi:hypothetical protein